MRRHVVLAVALLLIASLLIPVASPVPVEAAGENWLTGWTYRKAIVIDQTTDLGANVAYQMKLLVGKSSSASGEQVDCNDHCEADFDDLRFTKSDGTTLLDYWIESISGTGSSALATVWIETILLDDAADTTIYMYYGNSGASAASNGANTFIVFDDFERGSNGDAVGGSWTVNSGSVIISTDYAWSGTRSGKWIGGDPIAVAKFALTASNNVEIRFRFWKEGDTHAFPHITWGNNVNFVKCYVTSSEDIYYVHGTETHVDSGENSFADQWVLWQIKNISFATPDYDLWQNGTALTGMTNKDMSDGGGYNNILEMACVDTAIGHDGYIDNVTVKNYTATEPTWKSFGSEEAPPTVTTTACTGFDRTWAIVNGAIIAQGSAAVTQVGFDYGLTTSYGLSWTESGTYTAGQSFNAVLTGLNPATVYHFRAKAYNGAWGYGDDRVFSTSGSPTLYEEHNTGGDTDSSAIYGANCAYQTFTTNTTSIAHTVTSIKLMLKRTGSPGNVTVSIRHTAGGVPTGADLVTSTLNANTFGTGYTWYEFETAETSLEANTTYAIVVCAVTGDASNYVSWQRQATGTYAGGNAGYSTDSGSTWTSAAPADQLFEIWGNPCLEMEDAKVISGYLNTGDWLITCLYKNIYPPYYTDGTDVSSVFYLQLVDGSTVRAQTKVAAWGYKPGSIYLSTDMVAGLEWGKAYKVRIWGDFGSNPYMEYSLQSADWLGSALIRLDSWVRSAAVLMEQYYGTPLTVYIADRGLCLNSEGGVTFITGIPELSSVRPALFQTVIQQLTYTPPEYTQSYQNKLVWQTAIGSELAAMFTEAGNIFSLDGATVGAIIAFIFYAVIAALAFAPGHAIAAIVLPLPFLLAAWYIGFIALVVMGVTCSVAALLLVWQMWWKQG